jgi:restriction system protein
MLPLLELAADGRENRFRDAVDLLSDRFNLSDEDRQTLLPSGGQPLFTNRVGWANTYLKQAGLLTSPRRGFVQITEEGRHFLEKNPAVLNVRALEQFEAFRNFRHRRREATEESEATVADDLQTPDDALATAYR